MFTLSVRVEDNFNTMINDYKKKTGIKKERIVEIALRDFFLKDSVVSEMWGDK